MEKIDQYPRGSDLLWMVYFRSSPDKGDTEGGTLKLSGTLQEVAEEAQKIAEAEGRIIQCIKRRF